MPKPEFIPQKLKEWVEARNKYRLTHAQVKMARELGLNPKKFNTLSNPREPWKLTLPAYIEALYFKHFKRKIPEDARSIEQLVRDKALKKAQRRQAKLGEAPPPGTPK